MTDREKAMSGGELAFPTQMWDVELKEATWLDGGLTKRELFAALAMNGILAGKYDLSDYPQVGVTPLELLASRSVKFADAVLKQLERECERQK